MVKSRAALPSIRSRMHKAGPQSCRLSFVHNDKRQNKAHAPTSPFGKTMCAGPLFPNNSILSRQAVISATLLAAMRHVGA